MINTGKTFWALFKASYERVDLEKNVIVKLQHQVVKAELWILYSITSLYEDERGKCSMIFQKKKKKRLLSFTK